MVVPALRFAAGEPGTGTDAPSGRSLSAVFKKPGGDFTDQYRVKVGRG